MRKYKTKRGMAVFLCALMIFVAGGSSTSIVQAATINTEDVSDENVDKLQGEETIVYGKVTAISKTKVTISLLEEAFSNFSETGTDKINGIVAPLEKPNDTSDAADQKNRSSRQEDRSDTELDSDEEDSSEQPQKDGPIFQPEDDGIKVSYRETGETQTIKITDTSILKLEGTSETTAKLSDIKVGSILGIIYNDEDEITQILIKNVSFSQSTTSNAETGTVTLTGKTTINKTEKTITSKTIKVSKANQSGILASNGATATIKNSKVTKSGNTTSTDESNFYGLNSGVIATLGSTIKMTDGTVTTNAEGANAVFSTGNGSKITISNTTIKTTKNLSRGLDTTFGGAITAKNVNITTKGEHSAAIATDRGEGTVTVTGGTMKTSGAGSPGIYSTGKISVSKATLTATGSEAAVIEGKNFITVNNCKLTGYQSNGVMLYQSFSGDAEVGTGVFTMKNGSLTAKKGSIFYVTNTDAIINLTNATLKSSSGILLDVAAGEWGTEGENGGNVTLNAKNQSLKGNINCDDISTVILNFDKESSYIGTINEENEAKSIEVNLSEDSTWNVTGTSYVSVFTDEDEEFSNIEDNGNTIYYDSYNVENEWLNGETYELSDGGSLMPLED